MRSDDRLYDCQHCDPEHESDDRGRQSAKPGRGDPAGLSRETSQLTRHDAVQGSKRDHEHEFGLKPAAPKPSPVLRHPKPEAERDDHGGRGDAGKVPSQRR